MSRYRVTITVVYDIDTDIEKDILTQSVDQAISGCLEPDKILVRKQILLEKLKERHCNVHLGEFKPEDVLPYISKDDINRDYKIGDKVFSVRMNSQRYFVFRESLKCASCGLKGSKMILEHNLADKNPHFNLYAVENGKLVLMTKDHVKPKSRGGNDELDNVKTCCIICNNLKGDHDLTYEQVGKLRGLYDRNNSLPRKKLTVLINETRKKMLEAAVIVGDQAVS